MKKMLIVLVLLAIAFAGCAGGGEKEEKATPSPTPTQTPVPEKTEETTAPSSGGTSGGINTMLDLFRSKKVAHGSAIVKEEGKTYTVEFWYYFDASNKEVMMRMEGESAQGKGVNIIRQKYEDGTVTIVIYTKSEEMQHPEGCEWMEFRQKQTVSPSEYEDVKNEPVSKSFEATLTQQGNVVEHYKLEYVDFDPSLFQPDGKVCSFGSYMGR